MKTLVIIPSRYKSSRFPGKPLVNINGKTMIRRVYEQAKKAKNPDKVIVATDDKRIYDEVISFGGEVVMTSQDHKNGTERIAEVAAQFADYELLVNVQGDEPYIQPEQIDRLIDEFQSQEYHGIGTMIKKIKNAKVLFDPNIVKVVVDHSFKALYFSRQAIPFLRGVEAEDCLEHHTFYKHIGIYIFRNSVLQELCKLPQSQLEQAEKLEQLRWLENGYSIFAVETDIETFGIDTPEDLLKLQSGKS